ncbi:inversin-B-like [Papaver somniferum]|uniref:inversin-B-like n=1 Tax=Papaver somniferum TaxID=3469 RepID=UPI000E702CE9|nr:inversin-B-like [Papaver somniferum]
MYSPRNLDRFRVLASSYDKRGNGLMIQRLVDEDGTGSLAYAAAGGRVDVCRNLLEELNLYVDVKDNHGLTPLCYGAVKGHLDTVEYLLEQGANPDGSDDPNSTTNTPLHYAVLGVFWSIGRLRLMAYLLPHRGKQFNARNPKDTDIVTFKSLM